MKKSGIIEVICTSFSGIIEVICTSFKEYIATAVVLGIVYFFQYFVRNKIAGSKLTEVLLPYASNIRVVSKSFSTRELEVILNPEFKLNRLLINLEASSKQTLHPLRPSVQYHAILRGYSELPGNFSLFVYTRSFVSEFKEKFQGLEEVPVGDPAFDKRYAVFTNDGAFTKNMLSDEILRSYLLSGLTFNALEVKPESSLTFSILTLQKTDHVLKAFNIIERLAELIYAQKTA